MSPEPPSFALLWDMDGVIVDSGPYHLWAWQETFARRGSRFTEADFWHTFGQRNDNIITTHLGPLSADQIQEIAEEKERRYRARIAQEGIAPLPGAVETIRRLHRRGVPQAIVSSAPPENIRVVLEALGLAGLLAVTVSGEEVRRGKPDPESFLLAARRLGRPPQRCIVVEDAPAGIEAARRAGMPCLALSTTHPPEELAAADRVLPSLENLPDNLWEDLLRQARNDASTPVVL